ncbi:MAG: hypothetical protein JNM75_08450 [Rhodospirillales bacterium]|nr:hypothetical protein [Rhodospirillales bacterium]
MKPTSQVEACHSSPVHSRSIASGCAGADDLDGKTERIDQRAQGGDHLLRGVVDAQLCARPRALASSGSTTSKGSAENT